MSIRGISSDIAKPHICAPSSTAFMKQIERSWGVVGHFAIVRSPSSVRTRSVNVRPTSMSIEFIGRSGDLAMTMFSLLLAGMQLPLADDQIAGGQASLQTVDIDFDIHGDWVPRRQVFGLHLSPATRAIELKDAHPIGIRREGVFPFHDAWMDFGRVSFGDETAALVVLASRDQIMPAAVAVPLIVIEIEIEVLGKANAF